MSACSGSIFIAAPDTNGPDPCKNVSCEPGTYCSNGKCLSIVLNGYPCNPLNLKGDCPAGEACASGTCYPASSQPKACAVGVNGQCADPNLSCNTGNGQCGAVVNACSPDTAPSGQCRSAQRCVEGYCFYDNGLDCSADQVNGLCPSGEQCSTVGSCTAITGSVCDKSHFEGACSSWEGCAQGNCVGPLPPKALACSPNNVTGICPTNELCVNGGCIEITADNVCNGSHLAGLCAAGAGCLSPGYCEVLTADNSCSSSHLSGGCGYGGACEKGACVQTPCGQPGGYACAAGARCDVPSGQCVPVLCDSLHPQGACVAPSTDPNAQLACDSGVCVPPTCAEALDPNDGKCTYGLVCRAGGVCTPPDCGSATVDPSIPSSYCPNSHDVCSAGACVRRDCSPTVLDGVCAGTNATAPMKDPYRGTVQVPAVCCDANLANVTGCVVGQCSPPLCANSPNVVLGQCLNSASDYCNNGNCVAAPCTPIYPQGQCTAPEVCSSQAGSCSLPDCILQNDPNGYCAPKLCDQDTRHKQPGGTYDTCISPSCASNPNIGTCSVGQACCNPNMVSSGDPNCTDPSQYGQCITPACSFNYPGGSCGPGLLCTPTRNCDPNTPGNNCCARPPCSDTYPSGNCGTNFACALNSATSHYTCQIEMCSPLAPKGTCNTPGYRCYNGSITDPNYGTCQPFACSDYYPTAPCPIGTQCCLNGGHYSCQVPPCGLTAPAQPGGVCSDSNQICVAGVCITPACSTTYLAGACPSSQQCCDTALNAARNCEKGTCAPKACAASYLNGYCPAGQICCNSTLSSSYAGCSGQQGTCQAQMCSPSFPAAPCPTAGDICVSGSCQTPCSSTARKGWCPPSFACVNGACSTSCTNDFDCDNISNSLECPANPNAPSLCTTDTDGDGSPDSVDRDADNDGVPDVVERGCVASSSCTISTAPTATTPGTYDFRNLDSDGDRIGDGVEAGPVPSLPQDTDKDGLPNYRDTDSDSDGILDRCEATDAYGVCNSGNTLIANGSGLVDTNGNGKPDYMDLDSDSDGVSDHLEAIDKTGTFRPNGVYTRGAGYSPDYRNTDSDGDGVPDQQEDVNGNGIVDCQLNGNGNFMPDPRPSPACSAASSGTGLYYNPGCNCTAPGSPSNCTFPGQKCLFAETSRVEVDTNLNSIRDPNDAVFQVCGENNLKKINLYYSQSNDYAFALERTFQTVANVYATNGNNIGIAFDDTNSNDSNNSLPAGLVNGSYAVSGILFTKAPSGTALGLTQATALQKALAQAQGDGAAIGAATGVSSSALVINRNFMSFDGFGTVVSRYHVVTSSAVTAYALRNHIAQAIDSADLGSASLPTCINTATTTDFTVNMETLYRYDDTNTGRVIVILAVTPSGADQTAVDTYNYRPSCSSYSTAGPCLGQHGCTFTTGSCTARQDYQIPLFFADNITNGSAITQYGSDIAAFCQSLVQQSSVLDFMWVVDNSISMAPKIGQVSKASSLFFGLLNNTEADYRVGMTTTAASMDAQAVKDYTIWEPIFPGCFALSQAQCEGTANRTNNGGGCSWDSTASQCKPQCTPYTTSAACSAAGCVWNNPNSSCSFGGCSSITFANLGSSAQTTCTNIGCSWNATLGPQGECTHTSRTDRTNGSLLADFTGAVSGRYDLIPGDRSVGYRCGEGCAAEDQNTTLPGGLYDSCSGLTALGPTTCAAYPQCAWNGSACVANCCPICNGIGGTAPSASTVFNDAACYFASRLPGDDGNGFEFGLLMGEWAMYHAGAQSGCANAQDGNACAAQSGCVWYNNRQCIAATCSFTPLQTGASAADQCNGNYLPKSPVDPNVILINDLNSPGGSYSNQSMPEPAGCEYFNDQGGSSSACLPSLGVPCSAYKPGSTNFPLAACPAPRCHIDSITPGNGCVPDPNFSTVQCNATDATTCYQQGPNWCTWDTCSGHTSASECASVYGCYFDSTCKPIGNGGTCRPPLTKSIRANATRVAVLLSDEEECYVKDGSSGSLGTSYDGRCEFVNYGGGLMNYNDTVRSVRTNAYLQAYASRNFLTFAIVGDKADPSSASTQVANYFTGGGCSSPCEYYSGDPSSPKATKTGIAQLQAVCTWVDPSGNVPRFTALCPKTNGGCFNQISNGPLVAAEAGQAYINVAEGTGGGWGSICASNLYPSIESTVIASVAKASPYHLNGFVNGHAVQPIASTIQVGVQVCKTGVYPYCNTDPLNTSTDPNNTKVIVPLARSRTNGFDYDPSNNAIVLYGSARAFTSGDIVVSYRYWVNTSQPVAGADPSCPCPGTSLSNSCACDPGKSCGVSGPNPLPPGINLCSTPANNANETVCNKVAGCVWNSVVGCEPTGVCEYDPSCGGRCTTGQICDSSTGLCVCDLGCGNGCAAGKKCDTGGAAPCNSSTNNSPNICNGANNGKCAWNYDQGKCDSATCGQCVCDNTCGGGCAAGQKCDATTTSPTCGQCACDTTCGGGCPAHQACDSNPASGTCGFCKAPVCSYTDGNGATQAGCPSGQLCDASNGNCVCDTSCGGSCRQGTTCDASTSSSTCGQCLCDTNCDNVTCAPGQKCDSNKAHTNTCGLCVVDPACGNVNCNPSCAYATVTACAGDSNCLWKPYKGSGGSCGPKACSVCNPVAGLCSADSTCCGGCGPQQTCDVSSGSCVCDTTCGGQACQIGYACDSDPTHATCGSCVCDTTCGGPCPLGDKCSSDPSSANCGLCVVDPTCGGGCPYPYQCDTGTGLCKPSPCGVCPDGYRCSSLTLQCVSNGGG